MMWRGCCRAQAAWPASGFVLARAKKRCERIWWSMRPDAALGRRGGSKRLATLPRYAPPEETAIDAHLGYASRLYGRPPNFRAGWQGVYVQVAPPDFTHGGVLFPIEGDRWMVTLVGGDRNYPPTDVAGFADFARSLRTPAIHEALEGAEPLTPVRRYRATENRRRHYESTRGSPACLITYS
jgi:hypothetical protein